MDRLDHRVAQQVGEVGVHAADAQPLGERPRSIGRGAEQSDHLDFDPPQRLGMDRADEAPADQRGAEGGP